jgi:hypothetical protein
MPTKYINSTGMDQELNWVAGSNQINVLSGSPATFTQFDSTFKLSGSPLISGAGNGDFTVAGGDAGGNSRKVTITAKSGLSITASGSATCVAVGDTSGSTIRMFTSCTTQYLTSGGTVDIPAFKLEIADPT